MNKNQLSPRDLLFFPESKEAIKSTLESPLESAFVFVQKERFGAWLEFAVWEKLSDEKVVETAMLARLSGEPDLAWKEAAMRYVEQKRKSSEGDLSISRFQFTFRALNEYEALHGPRKHQRLKWAVEKRRDIGPEKFHKVSHLMSQIGGDCGDLLGIEKAAWVLKLQDDGELQCVTQSWGGTVDPLEYWGTIGEIFEMAFKELQGVK